MCSPGLVNSVCGWYLWVKFLIQLFVFPSLWDWGCCWWSYAMQCETQRQQDKKRIFQIFDILFTCIKKCKDVCTIYKSGKLLHFLRLYTSSNWRRHSIFNISDASFVGWGVSFIPSLMLVVVVMFFSGMAGACPFGTAILFIQGSLHSKTVSSRRILVGTWTSCFRCSVRHWKSRPSHS